MPKIIRDIPEVKLTEDQESKLAARLEDMVQAAEEYHSGWDELHREYQRFYLAQPKSETKQWPWPSSSNVFLPLVRTSVDATSAQFFDAMLASNPKVIGSGAEDQITAELLTQFYFDYVWSGAYLNLKTLGSDWNLDTLIDGTSAVKTYWKRDQRHERLELIEQEPVTEKIKSDFLGQEVVQEVVTDINQRISEMRLIRRDEYPVVELVDLTKLKVAPRTGPSLQYPDCDWYYEETEWTWDQAQERKRAGFDHIDDELLAVLKEVEPSAKEQENLDFEDLSSKNLKKVQVKVFYMRLSLPGKVTVLDDNGGQSEKTQKFDDGIPEDIIVWYLVDTRKISKIIPLDRLRPDGKRPHVDNRYGRLPRAFYGIGIPATLKYIQKIVNTGFNQMIDFGTLRNMPWAFFEPATTGLTSGRLALRPGELIATNNAGGITFPRLQGDNVFYLQLLQQAQVWSERATAVSDFTIGRSPSLPNAPRTARGTMALIQQASVAFSYRVALMAEAYLEMFRHVHVLFKKNAPREMAFRFFNRETGLFERRSVDRSQFAADVDFQFQLNPNRLSERQQNTVLFQMLAPYLLQFNPAAIREAAKELLFDAQGRKNFERIWPEALPPQLGMGQPGMSGQPQTPQLGGLGNFGTEAPAPQMSREFGQF